MESNKTTTPLLSVITVCYNAEKTIKHVLDSVLAQTFDNFEYVIWDGGSTDATNRIIESYLPRFEARKIPLLHLIRQDEGIYDAMNKATACCRGTWLNFMNADDRFYQENVLADIFSHSAYENYDILYGDALEWELGDYYVYEKSLQNIRRKMPFNHQASFIRKTVMEKYPYDTALKIGADYNFVCCVYTAGCRFLELPHIVCVISKEGVSSVDLVNKFIEVCAIHKRYDMFEMTDKEYARKLRMQKVKQFGMDYFPKWLKNLIRLLQRLIRGQTKKKPKA